MSLPVNIRPLAEADLAHNYAEMEALRPGLGHKFMLQVRAVLERIEAMPEMYGRVWKDVRAARLKRFRHVVYYYVTTESAEVLAVLHGARDSSTWQSRL